MGHFTARRYATAALKLSPAADLHGECQNSDDAKTFPYIDDETGGNSKRIDRRKEETWINMINRTEEKTSCVD